MLLYSTGMRLSEIAKLKIADIDSKSMRIKIVQSKGAKDRFTILSRTGIAGTKSLLYYIQTKRIFIQWLQTGKSMSARNIEHLVQKAVAQIGLAAKHYTVHTIRHSFATHLVDNGTDLHTVKELLGHTSLQTTMRYMHFTATAHTGIINPYDALTSGISKNVTTTSKKI